MRVNLKNKNGISLIVLVITIIVMIILAAAIILALNSSGIIEKANKAKTSSDKASLEEYVATLKSEWELQDLAMQKSFEEYANQKLEEKGYNYSVLQKADGTVEVALKGGWKLEKTSENSKVTKAVIKKGTEEIEVGSTVSYTAPSITNYTGTWKVLGVDEFGRIKLLSEDIGNQTLTGQEGFLNAEKTLNDKCAQYSDGKVGITARSIKVEDVDALTTFDKTKFGTGSLIEYANKVTFSWDGTDKPKYISSNKKSGNLNKSHLNGFTYFDKVNNTFKKINKSASGNITTLESDFYYYDSTVLSNSKIQEMIFGASKNEYYWLASRSVITDASYALFGVRVVGLGCIDNNIIVSSSGVTDSGEYAVRAVVILAYNTSLELNANTNVYDIK